MGRCGRRGVRLRSRREERGGCHEDRRRQHRRGGHGQEQLPATTLARERGAPDRGVLRRKGKAVAHDDRDRLGAARCAELAQRIREMPVDGALPDPQAARNALARQPGGHEREDLGLAGRKSLRHADVTRHPVCRGGRISPDGPNSVPAPLPASDPTVVGPVIPPPPQSFRNGPRGAVGGTLAAVLRAGHPIRTSKRRDTT